MRCPALLRSALIIAVLLPLFGIAQAITAQSTSLFLAGETVPLFAGPHMPPSEVRAPTRPADASIQTAQFIVTYTDFPPEAQAAFQAAINIWQTQISSSVPIRVDAQWVKLSTNVLGQAGPITIAHDFPGAPAANTFYSIALANKITQTDLDPEDMDIIARFNSAFPDWYFGTDGKATADQYDLESVVLHEIGHGLGFSGSARLSGDNISWGFGRGIPYIYDRLVVNQANQRIIDTSLFPNPSDALNAQFKGDNLFVNSPAAGAAGGKPPKLFAPSEWRDGSSFSHLDEDAYPSGDINSLMTPILNGGEVVHNPGPIMLGVFNDMGWTTVTSQATNTPVANTPTSTTAATRTATSPVTNASVTPTFAPFDRRRIFLGSVMRDAVINQPTNPPATPTNTASSARTATSSATASATLQPTRTNTATGTAVPSVTRTASANATATLTASRTATSTATATNTPTATNTATQINTPTRTNTPTITLTPSITMTQERT